MNQSTKSQWGGQESFGTMGPMSEDAFTDFLDLDNMDLNFPIFDNDAVDMHTQQQGHPQHGNIQQGEGSGMLDIQSYGDLQNMSGHMDDIQHGAMQQHDGGTTTLDFAVHQQYQQDLRQFQMPSGHNYPIHFNIPATPNSTEMHPHFMSRGQQELDSNGQFPMDQQYHMRKDDVMATLTPLVSPQIPSSTHSHVPVLPDFTMPGAYLSPLTSPAMRPQANNNQYHAFPQTHTGESSLAASPISLGPDGSEDHSPSINERPRKTRKRTPNTKPMGAVGKARQQQVNPSQRRKASLTVNVPIAVANDALNSPASYHSPAQRAQGQPGSAITKSVSPQPHLDGLMAPPPKPLSAHGTPLMSSMHAPDHTLGLPPATPASLMRLRQQQQQAANFAQASAVLSQNLESPLTTALGQSLEDLRLPDAATPHIDPERSLLPRIVTEPNSNHGTPAATPTPTQMPLSRTPLQYSTLPSPAVSAVGSKGSRSRKRGSTGSTLVSPALRPKISPSIKPLLPEGSTALSTETHALLLASKSNYQNIIEGTTLPGVSYPPELSTNLTSKRTSHKIAEQGRRNRINTALQEVQKIIPPLYTFMTDDEVAKANKDSEEDGSPNGGNTVSNGSNGNSKTGAAPSGGNSKAATVEHAYKYIVYLKKENERLEAELRGLKISGKNIDTAPPSDEEVSVVKQEHIVADHMDTSDESNVGGD